MEVTEATFEADVVEASRDAPVVVDFWAAWCAPCRALGPILEREAAARGIALAKVDVDANPALAARFGVRGIPAVKAFRNGHVVAEFVGARPAAAVAEFLEDLGGPGEAAKLAAELRASGELPAVAAALERGDHEAALAELIARVEDGDPGGRTRLRELMLAVFRELGQEHPLSMRYRRRLSAALY